MKRRLLLATLLAVGTARAQDLDLTRGGPVEVTATDGIEWRQAEQVVVARGDARAVRDGVTLEADRLLARYRPRAAAAAAATADSPVGGSEIWRMEAEGNVRISTATDRAQGDRAIYDIDRAVMVMSGRDLRLATADSTVTARDSLEYWPQRRMAVARGAAVVESVEDRRLAADVIVAYFLPDQPGQSAARSPAARAAPGEGSRLDRVEVFGNVEIRTAQEVVRGDRGVYSPVTGLGRLLGNVRITRGENQLNGQEAIVNLRSGVSRLVAAPGARVQGLVTPGQTQLPAPQQPGSPR
jgi:lipopolysaccharide export system protein LptA